MDDFLIFQDQSEGLKLWNGHKYKMTFIALSLEDRHTETVKLSFAAD